MLINFSSLCVLSGHQNVACCLLQVANSLRTRAMNFAKFSPYCLQGTKKCVTFAATICLVTL